MDQKPEKISTAEPPETVHSGGHWFQFILSPFPGFCAVLSSAVELSWSPPCVGSLAPRVQSTLTLKKKKLKTLSG